METLAAIFVITLCILPGIVAIGSMFHTKKENHG